jgi:hypothetical protein
LSRSRFRSRTIHSSRTRQIGRRPLFGATVPAEAPADGEAKARTDETRRIASNIAKLPKPVGRSLNETHCPFFQRATAAFRASCLTNRLPKYLRLFSPPLAPIFRRKLNNCLCSLSIVQLVPCVVPGYAVTPRLFTFERVSANVGLCFRETRLCGAETRASKKAVTFNRSSAETKPPHENPPFATGERKALFRLYGRFPSSFSAFLCQKFRTVHLCKRRGRQLP